MVNIVKDWNQIEEYAEYCHIGQYQTTETLDGKEIRVLVGRFGFIRRFKDEKDDLFKHIINYCQHNGFVEVVSNIPEEQFFKTAILE